MPFPLLTSGRVSPGARLFRFAGLVALAAWLVGRTRAGGPMGVDGGVVVSGSTVNLTPTLASNYVAAKTGWIRVNMILPSGHTTWDSNALGYYDTAINNAKAAGLQVLILMNNQGWTGGQSSWNANNCETTGGTGDNAYVDGWVGGVVTPLVQHFHDRVKCYEIWNEPSTWSSSSTNAGVVSYSGSSYMYPSCYCWLLSKSWVAAHETLGYSDVKIISGGVFGTSPLGASDPGVNSGSNYVSAFYSLGTNLATGAPFSAAKTNYGTYPVDGIGQHLYLDYNINTTSADLQQYLGLIRGAYAKFEGASTTKKTYVTEFGWTTASVSQQVQANNLATAFNVFETGSPYVSMAIWFNWQDSAAANLYFGVLDVNGNPKIAYTNYLFYEQYEGYFTNGTVEANLQDYFNAQGQSAYGDAFDNGNTAFVHRLSTNGFASTAQDFAGGTRGNVTIFDNTGGTTPWYLYPICVPFDDTNYDTGYGGSHDMDVQTPLDTPITSIVSGTVSSVDNPSWGWEIGIHLDTPITNGNTNAQYFAYLHLGAIKPGLAVGQRVNFGDLIAYSGGANSQAMLGSQTNTPFGPQFTDDPSQSSQPQTGMALMRGPEYGVGAGWTTLPDPTLDPTPTLNSVRAAYSGASGTFEVNNVHGLWTFYNANGGFALFGPPLDNEYINSTGTRQDFSNGSLTWNSTTGVVTNSVIVGAPLAATEPATRFSGGNATLNGVVLANASNTLAWFEWGTNAGYGQRTAATNLNGVFFTPVSAPLSGLAAKTIYHFRLDASNAFGVIWGADHLCTTGGRVKVWGSDSSGYGYTNLPGGLTNVVTIAAGAYHALALATSGSVVAWGYNYYGQTSVPANLTNAVALAAGYSHSLALKADGTVAVWGGNLFRQLNLPAGLTNVIAVAAGAYHSLALKADGTVVAWGYNNDGQTNVPSGLANVVGIAAGLYHSLALRADGTVVAWGANNDGQTNVPAGAVGVTGISAGQYCDLALKTDGTLLAWGGNADGQTNVPVNITNAAQVNCGDNFNLVLNRDGSVAAWGDNSSAQTNLPPGLTNVAQLAGGMTFGLAIANQAPQAAAQTVSGFVNHDLTIVLAGVSPDGNPLNFRVTTLPAAGGLYQFSGGGRGSAIAIANTPVSDSVGRIVFAPATNAVGGPYATFSFVANDGLSDSPPATVTVAIILPPAPQLTNVFWSGGNGAGSFSFNFGGVSNTAYSIWSSTNLLNWTWLGAAGAGAGRQYGFTDALATNWSSRFYRVSVP